jgi:hypothetical protein
LRASGAASSGVRERGRGAPATSAFSRATSSRERIAATSVLRLSRQKVQPPSTVVFFIFSFVVVTSLFMSRASEIGQGV